MTRHRRRAERERKRSGGPDEHLFVLSTGRPMHPVYLSTVFVKLARRVGLRAGPGPRCISFGAVRVDAAVGAALMRALEPVGIEAALAALTARERNDEAAIRLAHSALAEARYKAERAEAQFNAVEPANQNVFHNLPANGKPACLSGPRL